MIESGGNKIQRRITLFRWIIPVLVLSLALIHLALELSSAIEPSYWEPLELLILLAGVLSSWWILSYLRHSIGENEAAAEELRRAYGALNEANERQSFLLQVNRQLMEAEDEESLLEVILALPIELVPAIGCALVRFNDRGQAMPAVFRGEIPSGIVDGWETGLSVKEMRRHCQECEGCAGAGAVICPLIDFGPSVEGNQEIFSYCLPLERRGKELGLLTIFLPNSRHPGEQERLLLQLLAREVARALESDSSRSREMSMVYELRNLRHVNNLYDDLARTLAHIADLMEADGGILFLVDEETGEVRTQAEVGKSLGSALDVVRAMAAGADSAEGTMLVRDFEQDEISFVRSLLVTPIRNEKKALGSLALWASRPDYFSRRWARVMETVAGQAALMLENHHLYLHASHRAAMAERARLAREIHDGLAQTVGYLKLRVGQLSKWQQAGKNERVIAGLEDVRHLLDESYLDAREAIDGLRLNAAELDLRAWVDEAAAEFEHLSRVPVVSSAPPKVTLPPEVHAQMQRILQEALSNIRKHAAASIVKLDWELDGFWLTLRICDDGRGFETDDVPSSARYGLEIMHERAGLLNGDLQVCSQPGQGTEITLRLPV